MTNLLPTSWDDDYESAVINLRNNLTTKYLFIRKGYR